MKPIARSTKAQARKSPAELAARAAATNAAEGIHVRATRSKSELKKLTKARDSQAPGQGKTAEEKGHALTVSGPDVAVMDTAPLFALREQLKTRRNIIDEQIAAVEETIELLQRAPEPVVTESATETKGKPSRRSKPGVETSK